MRARFDCGKCGTPRPPGTDCVPCGRKAKAAYKLRHADKVKAARSVYKKALHAAGAAERAVKKAAKRAGRAARRREVKRAWKIRNKGAVIASTAQRFAAKLHATPTWANKFFIGEAYDLAARRTAMKCGGVAKWHVDHRVPLRHPHVCGLHVEHNLQVIPAVVNMAKGNRTWPDMPQ